MPCARPRGAAFPLMLHHRLRGCAGTGGTEREVRSTGNQNPRPRPAAWEWPPLSPALGSCLCHGLAAVGLCFPTCSRDVGAPLTEGPWVQGQGDRVQGLPLPPEASVTAWGPVGPRWSVGRGAAHLVSQHRAERFLFPNGLIVLGLQGEHRGAALAPSPHSPQRACSRN